MSPNTGVLQVLQDGRSLFATAISPPLLLCTPSHLLMAQAIVTRAGTCSALVPGQLPAPAREVESLLNVPRSPVDRSKRPRCSTKQRTQSQTSSQPQAPPPELLQGSPGPAATGATSPWHLQGTPGLLCPLPSLPQPQAAGPSSFPSQTQRSLHGSHVKGSVSVLALGATHRVRALILEHR